MKKTVPSLPVTQEMRARLGFEDNRYDESGQFRISSAREARELSLELGKVQGGPAPSAADIYGAAYICTAWRLLLKTWHADNASFEAAALKKLNDDSGNDKVDAFLTDVATAFADDAVWHGRRTPGESALKETQSSDNPFGLSGREQTLRNYILADLAAGDPAFAPFITLFSAPELNTFDSDSRNGRIQQSLEAADAAASVREPENTTPLATLRKPIEAAPNSIKDQLLYILTRWGKVLGDWASGLVGALDLIEEETRPRFCGGPGPVRRPGLNDLEGEARFSSDHDWMPKVVMIAKNVLVWLDQLSKSYGYAIKTLDQIPDEELDTLSSRGFNALWLIGLWERSSASRKIKQRMGNPEAAASAYSLFGYDIDPGLGGWDAMENLRSRAAARGIRMSSDMVPNHVGIDSDWVRQHPDRLLAADECPYPSYGWNSENLSDDPGISIHLEDHYWDRSDAAVVFRRRDNNTGDTKYIYHGNDGTTMPWNDTAQIDFLNPEAREAVIRDILHVARNFSIIRFDAAMVLARKSIRRLWFPAPGAGGAIPSRSEHALSDEQFDEACPSEFWRDVVDRVAAEIPGTLLLAEAFWMMEGYFVRSLGMHRVYNSAFMNMLRDGKNNEYRDMMKETLAFDPGILQRYVNFMNNPDEETAVEQFGKDDRYFAAATLLATLPGLPMFGHGQIEGLTEKYGMEYIRAYREEEPDAGLIARHEREIFPLIHRRGLFAGAEAFRLYDLSGEHGINENIFAYTNADDTGPVLIVVNNAYERASGRILEAAPVKTDGHVRSDKIGDALVPGYINDDAWVLIREMLSGLWYLRNAGDLRKRGLDIAIDGFGRQLYTDYRYERETHDGMWSRLAAELNGSGVANPDDAIANIRLRPIHDALDSLVNIDFISSAAEKLRYGKVPVWKENNEALKKLMEANRAVGGPVFNTDPANLNALISTRLAQAAGYNRFFSFSSRRIRMKANHYFPAVKGSDDESTLVLWSILGTLAGEAAVDRPVSEMFRLWGLGRWLHNNGITGLSPNLERRLEAAAIGAKVLGRHNRLESDNAGILANLMSDSVFREACGVNTWDGVLWFGANEWEQSVRALVLAAGCLAIGLFRGARLRRRIHQVMRTWKHAAAASEYKLRKLLERAEEQHKTGM